MSATNCSRISQSLIFSFKIIPLICSTTFFIYHFIFFSILASCTCFKLASSAAQASSLQLRSRLGACSCKQLLLLPQNLLFIIINVCPLCLVSFACTRSPSSSLGVHFLASIPTPSRLHACIQLTSNCFITVCPLITTPSCCFLCSTKLLLHSQFRSLPSPALTELPAHLTAVSSFIISFVNFLPLQQLATSRFSSRQLLSPNLLPSLLLDFLSHSSKSSLLGHGCLTFNNLSSSFIGIIHSLLPRRASCHQFLHKLNCHHRAAYLPCHRHLLPLSSFPAVAPRPVSPAQLLHNLGFQAAVTAHGFVVLSSCHRCLHPSSSALTAAAASSGCRSYCSSQPASLV